MERITFDDVIRPIKRMEVLIEEHKKNKEAYYKNLFDLGIMKEIPKDQGKEIRGILSEMVDKIYS